MPSVADRRCGTCKLRVSHTRGMHVVEHQRSFFFCSSKCRRLHGKRNRWARRPSVLPKPAEAAPPHITHPSREDWGNLPGTVVWAVQEQLGMQDMLSMARACKAWLAPLACREEPVQLVAEEDERHTWDHALHLLGRFCPRTRQATFSLDADSATAHIQALSRCTQMEHLTVQVAGPGMHPAPCDTWLPALGRLTALHTLTLEAPDSAGHHLAGMGALPHLTALRLLVAQPCTTRKSEAPTEEFHDAAAAALEAAPQLVLLQAPERVLPLPHAARLAALTALTALTITDIAIDPWHPSDIAPTHRYMPALAELPHLASLSLATPRSPFPAPYYGTASSRPAIAFLEAAAEHLRSIPQLHLSVTSTAMLPATAATLSSLAALTNLTSLEVYFTEWDAEVARLGALRTLRRLRRLSLGVQGWVNHDYNRLNEPELGEDEMAALCGGLAGGLEALTLALRPWWWTPIHALRHLVRLTGLRELALVLPEGGYHGREQDVQLQAVVPASYVPAGVRALQLEGYQLVEGA